MKQENDLTSFENIRILGSYIYNNETCNSKDAAENKYN